MKLGHKVLGLAVGQKSILVAEVHAKGGQSSVARVGEFVFPEGLSLSTPEKLGTALAQFLKIQKFGTKDAVIGLPAKRLLTRRKEIPAASAAIAASTLRLQAEGEFSAELDNLVMDFVGTPSTTEPTTVLLMATNKVVVDECAEVARAAGLKVHAVTSTGTALGRATSRLPGGDRLVLNLGESAAELVVQHGPNAAHLRHLNVTPGAEALGTLAGDIRRMMASIPQNGTAQTLALWDSSGAPASGDESAQSILEQRLSMQVNTPNLRKLVSTAAPDAEAFAPAVALALTAMEPTGLPVDFLHSRLTPPKAPGLSFAKRAAIGAGVLVVLLIGGGWWVLNSKANTLADYTATIAKNKKDLDKANVDIKRYNDAKAWIPTGPHFVTVLKDVTTVFPPSGIWATRLQNQRDANAWELEGQAMNEEVASTLLNKMLEDPRFSQPNLTRWTSEQNTRLYTFTIQFHYVGSE